MKRSSRILDIFRELSVGVRQWLKGFELALEQLSKRFISVSSRMRRKLTVIAGRYKMCYNYDQVFR